MNPIEFERACAEYLRCKYSCYNCTFDIFGGNDSTMPDILVQKNGKIIGRIEVKEPTAQCGQFVAFANTSSRTFIYSELNRPSTASKESLAILSAMSEQFDRYKKPSSEELGLNKQLYYDRVVDYYTNFKQTDFFITRENIDFGEFIIFPTNRIKNYFDISACYRSKKSGSHNPGKKDLEQLPKLLSNSVIESYQIQHNGKYTDLTIDNITDPIIQINGDINIQLKKIGSKVYRMTVLGKTNNPNVIFSIKLIETQKEEDLSTFKSFLVNN